MPRLRRRRLAGFVGQVEVAGWIVVAVVGLIVGKWIVRMVAVEID